MNFQINSFLRPLLFCFCLCAIAPLFAQEAEVATDFMRSLGKIYVVVGVIVLVFLGLVLFVWRMDRRLTKLENQTNHHV